MLVSIENVEGSNQGDFIHGDDFANALKGLKGADEIHGHPACQARGRGEHA